MTGRFLARHLLVIVVLLTATVGLLTTAQGWRSHVPTFDNLLYIHGGHQLLAGELPDRGILTSFGSYTPPGGSWLMSPGIAFFDDPRLYEFPGAMLLYVGTLVGIFLLAQLHFGRGCAAVAVIVYGLSPLAISGSVSLWPRYPLPFFYVWMAYCVSQWVMRRRGRYLAGALLFCSVGMFVFLEIAPAVLILPAIWLLWRPPLTAKPILVAGLVSVALWLPYLRFETERGFADVKSQVKRQIVRPADYAKNWCDPALVLRALGIDDAPPPPASRGRAVVTGNFAWNGQAQRTGELLAVLALVAAALCALSGRPQPVPPAAPGGDRIWQWFGVASVAVAGIVNEVTVARYISNDGILEPSTISAVRLGQMMLLVAGIAMLFNARVITWRRRLAARAAAWTAALAWLPSATVSAALAELRERRAGLVLVSLAVPWIILFLTIEDASRTDRLWWLWPLQVVLLAAAVTRVAAVCRIPIVVRVVAALAVIAVVADRRIPGKLTAWADHGWSGTDAPQMRVVDFVAAHKPASADVSIGYQLYVWRFMAVDNAVDPRYKVGADFDRLFRDARGVSNSNTCGEGVSESDDYRIVQTRHNPADTGARWYVDVPADPRFKVIEQIGPYSVMKRF